MLKKGVIEEGTTPPEVKPEGQEKEASADLAEHPSTRMAKVVEAMTKDLTGMPQKPYPRQG